ncbi:hypothetical protein GA0115240_13004 [Streptomyces sp. DvalAA-14]|uniref:WXG100 family type VII secretion target n=1 Tax=unclassified Streptomyces TaxID=2593676 RepID=UPI00081B7948|nr:MULTISPECIES: hypothetical protein [unclassified Streptomyces]MYS21406.1 hypothetical protein [Streptomyces sp. SID4948]SCD91832.1 hypothetical protein GA0115240_13004 [Streptomyces sp. DvalAA-14]
MSTPSGNLQQSSTATYSQAVQSLENARSRMTAVQGQVRDAAATLSSHYQGPDGQAYAQVMNTWLSEVDRIKATCEAMEDQLDNSLQASNKAQSDNLGAVQQQSHLSITHGSTSDGVYSAMTS